MVLGLIDFLLGGKKKSKLPKSGQVTTPMDSVGSTSVSNTTELPDGQSKPTQNTDMQFESSANSQPQASAQQSSSMVNKKPISEIINKIHEELKSTNDRMTEMVGEIKTVQNTVNSLGHRIDELEESKKVSDEKFAEFDSNLSKFLSLYEVINNQYNPFVEKEVKVEPKTIVIDSIGNSVEGKDGGVKSEPKSFDDLNLKGGLKSENKMNSTEDLDASLLELDTLNIEQAAGNAVPLTVLKNNTNSLVIILSWLEYLIKKVGIEETRNTLRYYTETLRWITPEVYFDLDKYLRGMKDKKGLLGDEMLCVRDHIVSLYFISKLNERILDDKLTRAVLQIIKQ